MKIIKRKVVEDLYRLTGKYWDTSDIDYLDTRINLAQKIDNRLWCEIESLADLAVRKKTGVNTLIEAMKLFGYEVVE